MTLPAACTFQRSVGVPSISTGKERDTESGNDYFGARYYGSSRTRLDRFILGVVCSLSAETPSAGADSHAERAVSTK